ncbi:MAG: Trm112 family protein [Neomegalonema sp.]|nr:Trm112 family protein [Neomegalonema sp.]
MSKGETSASDDDQRGAIDPKMLEALICPITHGALDYDRAGARLISRKAKLAFPIRGGVPIMLESEAEPIE